MGKNPYLTITRERRDPNMKKIQSTVGQHPEISFLCGCNRFLFEIGGGVLNKYNISSFYGLFKLFKI